MKDLKTKNMNMNKLLRVLLVLVSLSSCKDFLNVDDYFDDEFKMDSTFTQKRYIEAYMWGTATLFPDEAYTLRQNYTPGPYATDEGTINFREGNNVYEGTNFAEGFTTPDDLGKLNVWGTYYKIIRKCNTILTHMDEATDMTPSDRRYIEGYTRFWRAYAYYNILVDFGPPILLGDEIVENNEELPYYDRARSTYDEAVAYICTEFEAAGQNMPTSVAIMDFGRPTRGAAYALAARVRLIHASPAFNGGDVARRYFSNWTRKTDGVHYIAQTEDEYRWALAAAAARRIIDLPSDKGTAYELYTVPADDNTPALPASSVGDPDYTSAWPAGAAGIDHFRSYSEMFSGECAAPTVSEFIWARRSAQIKYLIRGPHPISLGGWGRFSVTQKMVDAYRMDDGRTIEEAVSDGYYSESGYTDVAKTFSGYRLNAGVFNMYVNREMRFYASVGFNEAFWPCLSTTDAAVREHTAKYYAGAEDGRGTASEPLDYSMTGYVLRKWYHPQDAMTGGSARVMDKVYPILRYAEILLNYAEALNDLTTVHSVEVDGQTMTFMRDVSEIKWAFNQVRHRAGLPGLTDDELSDAGRVQELIEQERMVEFMHENRRYYDVRRWGIYEETEREPIMGMNTDATDKDAFYQRVMPGSAAIHGRVVDRKLMFVPIPRSELRRLPSLDQNPGWQ